MSTGDCQGETASSEHCLKLENALLWSTGIVCFCLVYLLFFSCFIWGCCLCEIKNRKGTKNIWPVDKMGKTAPTFHSSLTFSQLYPAALTGTSHLPSAWLLISWAAPATAALLGQLHPKGDRLWLLVALKQIPEPAHDDHGNSVTSESW